MCPFAVNCRLRSANRNNANNTWNVNSSGNVNNNNATNSNRPRTDRMIHDPTWLAHSASTVMDFVQGAEFLPKGEQFIHDGHDS